MRFAAGFISIIMAVSVAHADDVKAPDPKPDTSRTKVPLRVVRILPDSHQALLFDKTKGTHVLADVGGSVGGYKVEDIDDDEVTLSLNGTQIVLALTGPEPSAQASTAPAAPAKAPAAPKPPDAAATPAAPPAGAQEEEPSDPYADAGGDARVAAVDEGDEVQVAAPDESDDTGVATADVDADNPYTAVTMERSPSVIARPGSAGPRSGAEGGAEVIARPGSAGPRSGAEGGAEVIAEGGAEVIAEGGAEVIAEANAIGGAAAAAVAEPQSAAPQPAAPQPAAPQPAEPPAPVVASVVAAEPAPADASETPYPDPDAADGSGYAPPAVPDDSAVAAAPRAPVVVAPSDTPQAPPPVITPTVLSRSELNVALTDFNKLATMLRGSFTASGVRLDTVADGSVFAKAGLRRGDVVAAVDGRPLKTIDDAADLYVRASATRAANIQIVRAGQPLMLRVLIQ